MKIEYHNLYIHFVLTTSGRFPFIPEKNRIRIEKYITGIINHNASKLYAIFANPEHLHFLVSRSPSISEEQLATIVSGSSERFINDNGLASNHFSWQPTAAAFSVSKSHIDKVCKYILNQARHHKKISYLEYEQFIQHYQQTLKPK